MLNHRDLLSVTLTIILWLSSASVVSAESAWVLWERSQITVLTDSAPGLSPKQWEVVNAFKDKQECIKAAINLISWRENHSKNDKDTQLRKDEFGGVTKLIIDSTSDGMRTVTVYVPTCLPEMVDPRPRGKE